MMSQNNKITSFFNANPNTPVVLFILICMFICKICVMFPKLLDIPVVSDVIHIQGGSSELYSHFFKIQIIIMFYS